MSRYHDAFVIECGPSGAAFSAVAASKDRRVLTPEREKFPRFDPLFAAIADFAHVPARQEHGLLLAEAR